MSGPGRPASSTIALTLAAIVVVALVVVVWNAPANWLALSLARQTRGVVLLADADGTIWSGSAVVALATPDDGEPVGPRPDAARIALPGRVTWTLEIERTLAPVLHLTHDGVLSQPLAARWRGGGIALDPGAATMPAALLRLAGAPLNTLLPEGRCVLQWNGLRFDGAGGATGDGTLRIESFGLALSAVRPLGDYRVTWTSTTDGLAWQLATERGPLELVGGGSAVGRRNQARITVRIAADAPVPIAAQLNPLLDMIGRRGPGEAVIETGGRTQR